MKNKYISSTVNIKARVNGLIPAIEIDPVVATIIQIINVEITERNLKFKL